MFCWRQVVFVPTSSCLWNFLYVLCVFLHLKINLPPSIYRIFIYFCYWYLSVRSFYVLLCIVFWTDLVLELSNFFHHIIAPTIPTPFTLEWQVHNCYQWSKFTRPATIITLTFNYWITFYFLLTNFSMTFLPLLEFLFFQTNQVDWISLFDIHNLINIHIYIPLYLFICLIYVPYVVI
jgi:hypothetical protein